MSEAGSKMSINWISFFPIYIRNDPFEVSLQESPMSNVQRPMSKKTWERGHPARMSAQARTLVRGW